MQKCKIRSTGWCCSSGKTKGKAASRSMRFFTGSFCLFTERLLVKTLGYFVLLFNESDCDWNKGTACISVEGDHDDVMLKVPLALRHEVHVGYCEMGCGQPRAADRRHVIAWPLQSPTWNRLAGVLQAYSRCAVQLNISTTGGLSAALIFELFIFLATKRLERFGFWRSRRGL